MLTIVTAWHVALNMSLLPILLLYGPLFAFPLMGLVYEINSNGSRNNMYAKAGLASGASLFLVLAAPSDGNIFSPSAVVSAVVLSIPLSQLYVERGGRPSELLALCVVYLPSLCFGMLGFANAV